MANNIGFPLKSLSAAFALLVAVCAAALFMSGGASAQSGTIKGSPSPSSIYYVSSVDGNDSWEGTSKERPWKSLARVSVARLAPGDQVLFKAGDIFVGQLLVQSSGAAGRPLRFASYGNGPKPLIDGGSAAGGGYSAAILIPNRHHIEISNLEITNRVDQARPGEPPAWSFGIHISNDGGGVLKHFRLTRLTIRDVFAEEIDHRSEDAFNNVVVSAIRFAADRESAQGQPSYFKDIVISGNDIRRSGRFGVQIGHAGTGPDSSDAHSRNPETGFNLDIVVRDNRFFELGGTAVQLAGARNALIENNDFERTGSSVVPDRMVGRGSGAWVINSRDVVAQHNRSRHVRGYKDSYGMHVDFGNLNILYQYNYSEDSEGGFVEILGNNKNVIWRYNISVNDGLREKEGNTIWFSNWSRGMIPSKDIYVYNNTIFVRSGLYPDLNFRAQNANIWNNIFYVSREAMIGEAMRVELRGGALDVAGNLFFGRINKNFMAKDAKSVIGDPLFVRPGATNTDGYRLRAGSPALGRGVAIKHPAFPAAGQGIFSGISAEPRVDFFGTMLRSGKSADIGA